MNSQKRHFSRFLMIILLSCSANVYGGKLTAASSMSDSAKAYADLMSRFWVGTAERGHLVGFVPRLKTPNDNPLAVDGWKIAQFMNVVYTYWKVVGSEDAAARIRAQWSYQRMANPKMSDLTDCGDGAKNNYAEDDTAWNVGWLLQIFEVTRDPVSIKAAKGALDCAYLHWWDTKAGGFWYSDHGRLRTQPSEKSSYQVPLIYDFISYFELTGDRAYMEKAIAGFRWVNQNLERNGQIVNNQQYPNDALYWTVMNADGTIQWINRPYHVMPGGSSVMLVGDMTAAVVAAKLYTETHVDAYKEQVVRIARGIKAFETDEHGVLRDARDPFVDGWATYLYAKFAIPILGLGDDLAGALTLKTSAAAIVTIDRQSDGSYGGDWGGVPNSGPGWSTVAPNSLANWPQTSANAVMVIMGAAAL